VLTGAGPDAFCAGADLKAAAAALTGAEEPLVAWTPVEIEAHNRGERDGIIGPSRWTDISKPIIAAVNGSHMRGASSGPASPTSASPTSARASASPAAAGTSASATGARSACPV
jgi:hypothetical protein